MQCIADEQKPNDQCAKTTFYPFYYCYFFNFNFLSPGHTELPGAYMYVHVCCACMHVCVCMHVYAHVHMHVCV